MIIRYRWKRHAYRISEVTISYKIKDKKSPIKDFNASPTPSPGVTNLRAATPEKSEFIESRSSGVISHGMT